MFSICVPSWNSLPYLKILHKGLKKNTKIPYELIVHDNASNDNTEEWLVQNGVKYTKSDTNLGFCGVNNAIRQAKNDYVITMNTDMYPLPSWDLEIEKQIYTFKNNHIDKFTISSCLIEPAGNNPEYTIFYAGDTCSSFNESLLLGTYLKEKNKSFKKENTIQFSHPILVPKIMLEEVNYFDEKYYPGWSSDYDLAKSLHAKGCRNFCMLGTSRVYHFVSKTFTQLPSEIKNKNGHDVFIKKWNQHPEEFRNSINIKKKFEVIK